MGSYQEAVDIAERTGQPADIVATRDYRYKYGFGLNLEQEIAKNVGVFSRLGWSDGNNEAWVFSDVDRAATLGLSVKGESWHRPDDTIGLAGALNGISKGHQDFFAAGGIGILAGDGALTYGWEQILDTYYDCQVWRTVHDCASKARSCFESGISRPPFRPVPSAHGATLRDATPSAKAGYALWCPIGPWTDRIC